MTAAIRCITLISTQNKKLPCHDRTFFSKLGWKTPGVTHYDSDKERALLKWQLHCLLASLLAWHATAWPKKKSCRFRCSLSILCFQSFESHAVCGNLSLHYKLGHSCLDPAQLIDEPHCHDVTWTDWVNRKPTTHKSCLRPPQTSSGLKWCQVSTCFDCAK